MIDVTGVRRGLPAAVSHQPALSCLPRCQHSHPSILRLTRTCLPCAPHSTPAVGGWLTLRDMTVSDATCLHARESDAINNMRTGFEFSDVVRGGLDFEYVDDRWALWEGAVESDSVARPQIPLLS